MSVSTTGVRWTALALLTTMSMPPKVATVRSIALLTWVSSRTSTTSGSARPPALAISSAAVKMVPESFGCGLSVLAAMAMLAPSRAARSAIASPMPRDAPVINNVRPLSVISVSLGQVALSAERRISSQRRVGAGDAVCGFNHGALEARGLHRQILREEARDGGAPGGIGAVAGNPHGCERLLGEERAAGREREQPQIRRRPGERGIKVVALAAEEPMGRAFQRVDRVLQPHARPSESRVIAGVDRFDRALDLADIGRHRRAARKREFARDQVDRLDAIGAFVDRSDARVAIVLRGARLLDVAHAAMHLHAQRCDLAPDVGRKRLGDRGKQRGALVGGLTRRFIGAALRAVECDGGGIAERARGAGERAHGEQHALDVGMRDNRARTSFHAGRPALFALTRVGERLLGRALGDRDALQPDRQARLVHHGEHAGHAAVLLADQEPGGAAVVAIDHGAGRRGMNAELVLDRMGAGVVALTERAVRVEQELGYQEE